MKTRILFLLLVLGSYCATAQPAWHWVNQLTSSGAVVSARGIITDAAGNSYVTGSFKGTAAFGRLTLTSRGATDLFLVKYNPAGNALWATQLGHSPTTPSYYPTTEAQGTDVALDAAGNAYVIGNFNGTVSYGTSKTISSFDPNFTSALVAKFNSRGQVQWVERFGIPQFGCYGYAIATDAAGNSYVTGQSDYGGIRFGNQTVGNSRRVMYVACYTATGAVAWAKVSGNYSTYGASGSDVALDGRGNCLVGGFFNNDITLDGAALTTTGADAYLASFNAASGSLQWIRQGGASGNKYIYISALATDAQGNVYAAGNYYDATALGGHPLVSTGESDQFVARYTRTGALQWVQSVGSSAAEYSTCLTATPKGYCTVVGRRLNAAYEAQTVLYGVQPSGAITYSETLGSSGSCTAASIAQDQTGKLYLTGTLAGAATFGKITLQTGSRTDGFVARLHEQTSQPSGNSESKPALEVYPNPTRGRLTVGLQWTAPGLLLAGKALLHNVQGHLVATQPLLPTTGSRAQAVFDCATLPVGLYVLKLYTPDGTSYSRSVEVK
ncbi:SBBP repeat-containing protein [Hymenobacter sp. HSC-4F20]|uniref:SBBP repeat-containing protein n=1 Tax=Hymenobacter sp. HSC-4F20 TaxID=2864135 RepID=UPI001C735502|nr:SBBP repeat-containing protein [Hymenobacter sp. HSC-4F20]MBX0291377.1 SBBP repeat-containing protein [Hymenobacter sp. HSC-4F20]